MAHVTNDPAEWVCTGTPGRKGGDCGGEDLGVRNGNLKM